MTGGFSESRPSGQRRGQARAVPVAQQTRELGIRAALGADQRQLAWLMVSKALRLSVAGVGAGLLLTYGVARWLSTLFFGVGPADLVALSGACAVLITAAATRRGPIPRVRAVRRSIRRWRCGTNNLTCQVDAGIQGSRQASGCADLIHRRSFTARPTR